MNHKDLVQRVSAVLAHDPELATLLSSWNQYDYLGRVVVTAADTKPVAPRKGECGTVHITTDAGEKYVVALDRWRTTLYTDGKPYSVAIEDMRTICENVVGLLGKRFRCTLHTSFGDVPFVSMSFVTKVSAESNDPCSVRGSREREIDPEVRDHLRDYR